MTECDELLVHQHIGLGRSLLVDVTLLTSETIAVTAGDLRPCGSSGMAGVAVLSHEVAVRHDGRGRCVGSLRGMPGRRERHKLTFYEQFVVLFEHVTLLASR